MASSIDDLISVGSLGNIGTSATDISPFYTGSTTTVASYPGKLWQSEARKASSTDHTHFQVVPIANGYVVHSDEGTAYFCADIAAVGLRVQAVMAKRELDK